VDGWAQYTARILSPELRKHFQFVFFEGSHGAPPDVMRGRTDVGMDLLVAEVEDLRTRLGHERVAVLGHTASGLIALEYARRYPQHVSHVIMIGTPPHLMTLESEPLRERYWRETASEERRVKALESRKALLPKGQPLPFNADTRAERMRAHAAIMFYDMNYDPTPLFEGLPARPEALKAIYEVGLANYNPTTSFVDIQTPVFLAIGRYDFGAPPVLWDLFTSSFPNLTVKIFEKSGTHPPLEEPEAFDRALLAWLREHP
jgi:proline iminopeptidase